MAMKEIAGLLKEASKAADAVMEDYLKKPTRDLESLTRVIRLYAAAKMQLTEEETSDNITVMVRHYVSRISGIPADKLKEMDKPGACGSAPAVLAKRILFFLDVQGKLGVKMPPEDAGKIQTVQDLAEELLPLIQP